LKLFTQNIDCLEHEAGVPADRIIEAHGSFAKQSCIDKEKHAYPEDLMRKAIREKTIPTCLHMGCEALVKPDIVFFGESLPREFFVQQWLAEEADLCIVMGTSLSVAPFSSLPEKCRNGAPRLLINSERVGRLGERADDVLLLEDCDTGVRRLAEACGWLEELESLWAETAGGGRPQQVKAKKTEEPKKNRDEVLQDEVDKLTREVEESLKIHKAQHEWLAKHVDNKFARIRGDEDETTTERQPAAMEETTSSLGELKDEAGAAGAGGGLKHVYPWMMDKKDVSGVSASSSR
jgi:NAD-dependent histone deacetylase SIR2